MPDRIAHDHPTVPTIDGTLRRYGGTHRPEIRLPADESIPRGDVVRLVLDGAEYRARIAAGEDGTPRIRGAFQTPRLARDPGEATNHLGEWVDDRDLDVGRTVHLDVIDQGHAYGLRAPGESAFYDATSSPEESLADIAADLDGYSESGD
ncbi:MAG: hypothetical protein ABEJ55_04325 [Halanaeroarchaeum sp.]